MTRLRLVLRGLTFYGRTHAAVVLGVATAVAVLAGALLVGDSVRGSLRDLVVGRLGRTDRVVLSSGFFRDTLASDIRGDDAFPSAFTAIDPLIVVQGLVTDQASGRRRSHVVVYGVDDRFWRFHGLAGAPAPDGRFDGRDALLSGALAAELGTAVGGTILVRVAKPSAIPLESLHGRKDDVGRTVRLTLRAVLAPDRLGEFSLQPRQGDVHAVFVPLPQLQQELGVQRRVNTLLVADRPDRRPRDTTPLDALVRRHATLEDVGLTVRAIEPAHAVVVESAGGLLDEPRARAAGESAEGSGMTVQPVFTYLANSMRSGDRQVPYSLVAGTDLAAIAPQVTAASGSPTSPPIVVNEWTARDLGVARGDPLTLEYYVWEEPGRLLTRTADFRVAAVVPIEGAAADRDLAPTYPGITDSERLSDWDPPFPIDLKRVRPKDEEYWKQYRTTPKAFIPLAVGQSLWGSRDGDRTSVRVVPGPDRSLTEALEQYAARLRARIDPLAMGLSVADVRATGLAASRGATDFGEYFTYFSFFLVLSALLLATLFFRLGIEQRAREVGLLRAVGYSTADVRRLFMAEALVLVAIGSLVGAAGAVAYASGMIAGLRTWWSGAVGTTALTLHVSPLSLVAGAIGSMAAAMVCVWWTLRGLERLSERGLLAGEVAGDSLTAGGSPVSTPRLAIGAVAFGALGAALVGTTMAGAINRTGAFFGAGSSLLVACLCLAAFRLRRTGRRSVDGRGWWPVWRLGPRNAAARPGRSVLAIGVIASATFILISVEAFRHEGPPATDRHSGIGGYPVLVDTLLPLVHDPNSSEGRELLGLSGLDAVRIDPFRVRPGEDASCLNLYQPTAPRVLGASQSFIASDRFTFAGTLAPSEAERANPWLLLNRDLGDGAVPVVADANSMTYVLHKTLGDEIVIAGTDRPVRLRLVGALRDSVFQSELLMADANFVKLFPGEQGYRFLLVDTPSERAARVTQAIERGGVNLGADAASTIERLAEFHRVENTYISTFQALGGLGLLVGTVGLAAVLLRNVLERRRELALLGAVGYRRGDVFAIVLAENVLLLAWGLGIGAVCAAIAIAPAVAERGGQWPTITAGAALLILVLAAGVISSMVATRAALRAPLLSALRAE